MLKEYNNTYNASVYHYYWKFTCSNFFNNTFFSSEIFEFRITTKLYKTKI